MRSNQSNYIKRLKNRKEDALEYIIDKYMGMVKYAVYKILAPLHKPDIIDECVNDIFFSIWNNADKFKGEEPDFSKWLYKIAKFKAIDYFRKVIKNSDISLEDKNIVEPKSVEEDILNEEIKDELLKLINILQPMDRDILIMKYILGEKSDYIAERFGLTRTALDNRIYRAKIKLRKHAGNFKLEVM